MDSLFKMIDRLFQAIPPQVQKTIRLGALGVWGVLIVLVAIWSYRKGSDSAPQSGEDLYLSTIKEKVYKDRMKRNPGDVTLPDLNELNKKETAPLSVYDGSEEKSKPDETEPNSDLMPLPADRQDDLLFPEKGVRPDLRTEPSNPGDQPMLLPPER